jgi:hypothetical protein
MAGRAAFSDHPRGVYWLNIDARFTIPPRDDQAQEPPPAGSYELREDGGFELREDGGKEVRQ